MIDTKLTHQKINTLSALLLPAVFMTLAEKANSRFVVIAVIICFIIWLCGELNIGSKLSPVNKDRAEFINNILMMHLAIVPFIFVFQKNHAPLTMACAGAGIVASAISYMYGVSHSEEPEQNIYASSRGLALALVAIAFALYPGSLNMTRAAAVGTEAVYFGAMLVLRPVYGPNGTLTIDGTAAVGNLVTNVVLTAQPPVTAETPGACVMCGVTTTPAVLRDQNACFDRNALVKDLKSRATENAREKLPKTYGMSETERICLQSTISTQDCVFCEDNLGCVASAPAAGSKTKCSKDFAQFNGELAQTMAESELKVKQGAGVLTMNEQLAELQRPF